MSHTIPGYEYEQQEVFDWHHMELFNKPPYSHTDIVYHLTDGKFIVEGEQSDFQLAEMYCQHTQSPEAWQALREVDTVERLPELVF